MYSRGEALRQSGFCMAPLQARRAADAHAPVGSSWYSSRIARKPIRWTSCVLDPLDEARRVEQLVLGDPPVGIVRMQALDLARRAAVQGQIGHPGHRDLDDVPVGLLAWSLPHGEAHGEGVDQRRAFGRETVQHPGIGAGLDRPHVEHRHDRCRSGAAAAPAGGSAARARDSSRRTPAPPRRPCACRDG